MFRLSEYWPVKPVSDPISLGQPKQSFKSGVEGVGPLDDYDMFDVDGEVYIFRKQFVAGHYVTTGMIHCMDSGYGRVVGEVAEEMLKRFSAECPRPKSTKK